MEGGGSERRGLADLQGSERGAAAELLVDLRLPPRLAQPRLARPGPAPRPLPRGPATAPAAAAVVGADAHDAGSKAGAARPQEAVPPEPEHDLVHGAVGGRADEEPLAATAAAATTS